MPTLAEIEESQARHRAEQSGGLQSHRALSAAARRTAPIEGIGKFNQTGIVFGTVLASFHIIWAFLVMAGWAQPLIDLVFWAHMLQPIYVVKAFDPWAALALVAVTFTSGYAFGFIGAFLWNKLRRTQ